jgi:hypothetical protein
MLMWFVGFILIGPLYFLFEPIIRGKSRDEIKKAESENFNNLKKKKLREAMLALKNEDFEQLFLEISNMSEGQCINKFSIGLLETFVVYGEVKAERENTNST